MRAFRLAISLCFAACLTHLFPARANAYNCTPVPNARPALTQVWNNRCIPYVIGRQGSLLSGESKRRLIAQSFGVWSSNACTDLSFMDLGYTSDLAGFDPRKPCEQRNVILSVEDRSQISMFPDPELLAITLTAFAQETGEIFNADILLNGVSFKFTDVADVAACESGDRSFDLRNTLIHEMGHFIGFDHVPGEDSTMFASAKACETSKRDLAADDRVGVCAVYARGQASKTCAPPAGGYEPADSDPSDFRDQCARGTDANCSGCSCTGTARSSSHALVLAAALALVLVLLLLQRILRGIL